MGRQQLCLLASGIFLTFVSAPTSPAATTAETGYFCGSGRCLRIPAALTRILAQRDDAFRQASAPRPAPFYRITVSGPGEGYIHRTILWVPSRKVWYLKEDVSPPLPGYWRTENAQLDSALGRLARLVRPFPTPKRWILPK